MRADVLLVRLGKAESREKARKAIEAGYVKADGKPVVKPAQDLEETAEIELSGRMPYVSRGGEKLARAIDAFSLSVAGLSCADFGASTGGFTDCLLQHGAGRVTALDVGHGQLHPNLLADPRVISKEGFNLHRASASELGSFDFICADLSFISLTEILPLMRQTLKAEGQAVCLVKPQFEAGRAALNKNGIVKKEKDRFRAICRVCEAAESLGFSVGGLTSSPFPGQSGNLEYLLLLTGKQEQPVPWRARAEALASGN